MLKCSVSAHPDTTPGWFMSEHLNAVSHPIFQQLLQSAAEPPPAPPVQPPPTATRDPGVSSDHVASPGGGGGPPSPDSPAEVLPTATTPAEQNQPATESQQPLAQQLMAVEARVTAAEQTGTEVREQLEALAAQLGIMPQPQQTVGDILTAIAARLEDVQKATAALDHKLSNLLPGIDSFNAILDMQQTHAKATYKLAAKAAATDNYYNNRNAIRKLIGLQVRFLSSPDRLSKDYHVL